MKREKLTYDVLQSIINLAAEGSEWLQHVFVHVDEPLTFLVCCSAVPILASTIVSLVIRKVLKQTKSAEASFNLGLLQDHGFIERDIIERKILHVSERAAMLELLKDDPSITTASRIIVMRPKALDDACTLIGGLYECVSRISKFAHLTSDRLHIVEKRPKWQQDGFMGKDFDAGIYNRNHTLCSPYSGKYVDSDRPCQRPFCLVEIGKDAAMYTGRVC